MAAKLAARIGVDPDLNRLAGAHIGELRFLVVGGDPDFVGHEHHQALPGRRKGALRSTQLDDPSGLGCHKVGVFKIQLGLIELGLRLLPRSLSALALSLQ